MRDTPPPSPRGTLLLVTPFAAALATAVLLAFILTFFLWDAFSRSRQALAEEEQRALWGARVAAGRMERQLDRMDQALDRLAALGSDDPAGLALGAASLLLAVPGIDGVAVWDSQGQLVAAKRRSAYGSAADEGGWPAPLTARLFREASAVADRPRGHFVLVVPAPEELGQPLLVAARWEGKPGTPGARLDAVALNRSHADEVMDTPLPVADASLALFRDDGAPLYPDREANFPAGLAASIAQGEEGSSQDVPGPGGPCIAAFRHLRGHDAVVLVEAGQSIGHEAFISALKRNPVPRAILLGLVASLGAALVLRTRDQHSLLQRVAMWEKVAEDNPSAILVADAQQPGQPVIYANPATMVLTGRSPQAMWGLPSGQMLPDMDTATRARLNAALAEGRAFHAEVKANRPDGMPLVLDIDAHPIVDASGHVTVHVFSLRDMTEQHQAGRTERAAQLARDWALDELRKALDRASRSEERFRDFAASASDWFWETDPEGRILWRSDNAAPLPGWGIGEVPKLPRLAGGAGGGFRAERTVVSSGGEETILEVSGRPVMGEDGTFQGYRGVVRDITEAERMAGLARRNEQRLAVAVEHLPVGLLVLDPAQRVLYCNERLADLFGIPRPRRGDPWRPVLAQLRQRFTAQFDPELVAALIARQRRLAGGDGGSMNLPWLDGRTYRLEQRRHAGGDRSVVVVDITALEASRARLMDAVSNITSGFAIFDPAGRLVLGNDAFHALLRPHIADEAVEVQTAQQIFARLAAAGVFRLMNIDGRPASEDEIATRLDIATGDPFLMTTPDGRTLQVRLRQSAEGGRIVICNDVTLLRQMDTALRSSEAKFRGLAQASSDGILIVDTTGDIQFANDEARRMFGLTGEDDAFDSFATLLATDSGPAPQALLDGFFAARRSRVISDGNLRGLRRDGTAFPVEIALSYYETPDGPLVQATIRDITQRLQAEETERQRAKMVALGTLAGGIAHDLNNALVPILSLGELLLDGGTLGREDAEMLGTMMAAAERARNLVRDILAFSRRGTRSATVVDLGAVVAKDLPMLRAGIPSAIQLDFQPATAPLPVQADETNLHQIVVNLVTNAAQAIGAEAGEIRITVQPAGILPAGARRGMAQLIIADNGPGMDEETRQRLFEPFFTTKPAGEGTGLGLAIVHNIVTSSGGDIAVETAPGKGTRFTISFPLIAETAENGGSQSA